MAKLNSSNNDFTNNSDGWDMSGGTTRRKVTLSGGDINIVGSGVAVYTFPGATTTLVGTDSTQTLTNKTITAPITTLPVINSKIPTYNSVTTTGWGVPAIYGTGRSTAQNAAVASVATYTVGAADGSFLISANVLITTATAHTIAVQVDYTDEGNTARTLTLNFSQLAGTIVNSITNVTGAGPYEGIPVHVRAKAATAITVKTTGTFTTVTYNVEGSITQIA